MATSATEPWLARKDWAKGEIASNDKSQLLLGWSFALIWNGFVGFFLSHFVHPMPSDGKALIFLSVFALIGALLLISAIYVTVRRFRLGSSRFKMVPVPGVIGGQLSGAILTSKKLCPPEGFRQRLRCVHHCFTGSGKSRMDRHEILWEQEKIVVKELGDERDRSVVPVFFPIPLSCRETNTQNSDDAIRWQLQMEAELPGVDYSAQFEVPVFTTEKSSSEMPAADPLNDYEAAPPQRLSASSRIKTRELPTGEKEFFFGAGRNPGSALCMAVISFLFFAGMSFIYIVFVQDLPVLFRVFASLFPLIFGLLGLLFAVIAAGLLFKSSRVTIGSDEITIKTRYVIFSRTRKIPLREVIGIDTDVSMSSGENTYQNIQLLLKNSRPVCVADNIRDRMHIEFLVREMKAALKLK